MAPMPLRPGRSAVPRVVGVLAIVFALLGAGASLVWWYGPLDDLRQWGYEREASGAVTWLHVWLGLSGVLFLLHGIGGILAVQYKKAGLRLLTFYGIGAIALAILDIVLMFAVMPERFHHGHHDIWFSVVGMHVFHSVMALPWPITALALVNGARAREACEPSAKAAADVF